MEWLEIKHKIKPMLAKYKYVALIIIIGIILMMIPARSGSNDHEKPQQQENNAQEELSVKLEAILQKIKGAGKVEVILTESKGVQYIYQTNDDAASDSDRNDRSSDTVIVTDSERNQTGLISTTIPAVYMGAVVVCEGGDDPSVKLAIVDAVSKATGLGSDKISVLKMK